MVDKRRRSSGPCHKLNLGCGEERGEGEEKGERKERGEVGGGQRRREGRMGNISASESGYSCLCTVVLVNFATLVKKHKA